MASMLGFLTTVLCAILLYCYRITLSSENDTVLRSLAFHLKLDQKFSNKTVSAALRNGLKFTEIAKHDNMIDVIQNNYTNNDSNVTEITQNNNTSDSNVTEMIQNNNINGTNSDSNVTDITQNNNTGDSDMTEMIQNNNTNGDSVPFYLYEEILHANNCTIKDIYHPKIVDSIWLEKLVDHPWRTKNPDDAILFVIPVNLGAHAYGWCTENDKFVKIVRETLEASKMYQKKMGKDHVVLSTYFKASQFIQHHKMGSLFKNVIWVDRLNKLQYMKTPCQIAVMHNSPPPSERHQPKRTLFFNGQADTRLAYKYRVRAITSIANIYDGTINNNMVVSSQCSHDEIKWCSGNTTNGCCLRKRQRKDEFMRNLSESRWNLMISGDDAGSSRLNEAVSVGVPSIIISPKVYERYLSFKDVVPWKNFTVIVNTKKFMEDPEQTITEVLEKYDKKRDEMVQLQDKYAKEFQWGHPESRAATNTLKEIAKKCLKQ